jgi:hypothetical protein
MDDEQDDDFDDDMEEKDSISSTSTAPQGAVQHSKASSVGKSTQFAGIGKTPNEHEQKLMTMKIASIFFAPTFGFLLVREFFRRRREEKYVTRGLEIMKVQRAEYFNETKASTDVTADDALKGGKNETKTDDDDDEEDDEDEEEDLPPRGRPKRPLPRDGGPSGSSGGAGSDGKGGSDLGYNKASSSDIDKLKNLYKRS